MSNREILAENSYQELIKLGHHFAHFGPIPNIIGGWAVYFYNSYYGSVDIDVVGPTMDGRMMYILTDFQGNHDYEEVYIDEMGFEKSLKKPVYIGARHIGDIEIDACTYEEEYNVFHEDPDKRLPYALCERPELREKLSLSEEDKNNLIFIPNKSLLLLYKIKAFRDRSYDVTTKRALIAADKMTWLEGKIVKDGSDIIALLDPKPSRYEIEKQLDPAILKKIIDEYDLRFILDTLENIHNEKDSLLLYPNAEEKEVNKWATDILKEL